MSSIIEDPEIPLVGMNGKHRMYSTSASEQDLKRKRFETVGSRLAKRKELYCRRKRICDIALLLALSGIVLMVMEFELCASSIISKGSLGSYFLKSCISGSTVGLIVSLCLYHRVDIKLFIVDNSVEDWCLAINLQRVAKIVLEILICSVHPIPGEFYVSIASTSGSADGPSSRVAIPVDIFLALPMFLRCYLVCRAIMLHSRLYQDASSQSLGALNQIHFNFAFIFKSLMSLHSDYVLTLIMVSSFLIGSWLLRLCEIHLDPSQASLANTMWLIAITFLSVGYGDMVPVSYCGRGIAVITGVLGAGCTALVVAVLARKLEFTRAEKYVHDFVIDADLDKRIKHEAANVLKAGWLIYKATKSKEKRSSVTRHQRKLLHAIYNIRERKAAQRRLMDAAVTLVEMNRSQLDTVNTVSTLRTRQLTLEDKVDEMGRTLKGIYDQLHALSDLLNPPHRE